MSSFAVYPKIRTLRKCPEIFEQEEVIITEKIHGKNMRILIPSHPKGPEDLIVGSREYSEKDDSFGLRSEARALREIVDFDLLYRFYKHSLSDVVIVGELYGRGVQQEIVYREDKGFAVFDIIAGEEYLPYWDVVRTCRKLSIEVIPLLSRGKPDELDFDQFINRPSLVSIQNGVNDGNNLTEGIVIRTDPLTFNQYDEPIICKHKSLPFRENRKPKPRKETDLSGVESLTEQFVTEIRVKKMIEKLKEKSLYTGSMKDVRNLGNEVAEDIAVEEKQELAELLERDVNISMNAVNNAIIRKTATIFKVLLKGSAI